MPSRILRDGILDNKRLGRMSEGAQLLYYKLLSLVGTDGTFPYDVEFIRVKAFKWTVDRYSTTSIEGFVEECINSGLLLPCTVDGENHIALADPLRGNISSETRKAVLAPGVCVICGSSSKLEVDHIIPVARGGKTLFDNLQALCRRCNRSKGASIA